MVNPVRSTISPHPVLILAACMPLLEALSWFPDIPGVEGTKQAALQTSCEQERDSGSGHTQLEGRQLCCIVTACL